MSKNRRNSGVGSVLRCLDLCAGLGGFSEAFLRSPHWEIMRIDNNPLLSEVPNMHMIDILEFRDILSDMIQRGYQPDKIELIVASPPCLEFSMGFHAPRAVASREGRLKDYEPNMDILQAVKDIIQMLNPRYYIIENVKGAVRYFKPFVGQYSQRIGAYFFWGKFPTLKVDGSRIPNKSELDTHNQDPLRANRRGHIPFEISNALKLGIEQQTTLDNWFAIDF